MIAFLKNCLVITLITLVLGVATLFALEGFARWQIDNRITPLTHYLAPALGLKLEAMTHPTWSLRMIPAPFVHMREEIMALDGVRLFPEGYRGVENQAPFRNLKKKAAIPLYVYGGALTFGYGLDDADTLPSLLQKKLNGAAGKKVAVFNFSSAFDRAAESRIRLANHLIAGKAPAVAVVVAGWGDFVFASSRDGLPHGPMPFKPFDSPTRYTDLLQSSYFFGYFSRMAKGLTDPIAPLVSPAPGFSEASDDDIALARDNLSADLGFIDTMAASENIGLLVALEPDIHAQQKKGYAGLMDKLAKIGIVPLRLTGDPRTVNGQRANAEQIAETLNTLLER